MLHTIVRWGVRLFPERQLLLRSEGRVRYITLTRPAQWFAAFVGLGSLALLAYGIAGISGRPVAERTVEARQSSSATKELQAQIDQLQGRLAAANVQLAQMQSPATTAPTVETQSAAALDALRAETEAQIKGLQDARDHIAAERDELRHQLAASQDAAIDKTTHLSQLNRTLEANRGELRQSDAQRAALQSRVHQLEADLESANSRTGQYRANLESIERKLQQLAAEHDKILAERDRLQARVSELQSKLSSAVQIAPPPAEAGAQPSAPVAPPPRATAERLPDQRSDNARFNEVERLIASTGIDVEKLLGRLGSVPPGQGGPFVALDKAKRPAAVDPQRSAELQKVLKTLPLATPLAHFQVESGFGGRPDPFVKKQAFHTGVDLAAPYRTAVYSTAPGTVVFTGVKEGYGKVVDIDHGHGIVSRYAHLHRIVVANGQKIPTHHQVGELGSTGRSTGPHLHYEVLVNGTAQDPEKFIQAGKNVVQATGGN